MIVLGSIIAEALKHTGAIQVITRSIVNLVGSKRMPLALTLTGFIIGVAIFSDVAYVILNPLVHSAAKTMGVSIVVMSTGLVGALQLTHASCHETRALAAAATGRHRRSKPSSMAASPACLVHWLAGRGEYCLPVLASARRRVTNSRVSPSMTLIGTVHRSCRAP